MPDEDEKESALWKQEAPDEEDLRGHFDAQVRFDTVGGESFLLYRRVLQLEKSTRDANTGDAKIEDYEKRLRLLPSQRAGDRSVVGSEVHDAGGGQAVRGHPRGAQRQGRKARKRHELRGRPLGDALHPLGAGQCAGEREIQHTQRRRREYVPEVFRPESDSGR